MVMYKFNDSTVSMIDTPINQIQFIAGKAQTLEDEKKDKEMQNKFQNFKPTSGYGNTGYMYFYENAELQDEKLPLNEVCQVKELCERIEKDNREAESEVFKVEVKVSANSNERGEISMFGPQNEKGESVQIELEFDYRKTAAELVAVAKKALKIPEALKYKTILLHKMTGFARPEREFLLCENADQLDISFGELCDNFGSFRYKWTAVFLEFVPDDVYEKFDYQKTYFQFTQVEIAEGSDLGGEVIGYHKYIRTGPKQWSGVNREDLRKQVPNHYKVDTAFSAKSIFTYQTDLCVLKLALHKRLNIPLDRILLYSKPYNEFKLMN